MRTTQGGKKQAMKHRRREGSKNKDKISSRQIDQRNFWIFSAKKKNRYEDDEKKKVKKKDAKKNEIKNRREE